MLITKEWLKKENACREGYEWAIPILKSPMEDVIFLEKLICKNKIDWANWVIVRIFDKTQKIKYAIYAAEQVIDIYEKKYPLDNRPRKAIESTKNYLNNPSKKSACAAADAADAAAHAAYAAYVAADASYAAADAAADASYAAADAAADASYAAADAAAYAAYAAADAVYYADYAAVDAAEAVNAESKKEMQTRILNYGISLLKKG